MRELIRTDDPRWAAMLAACPHDFYHLPGYLALAGRWEGGDPRAFLVRAGTCRLLLPVLVRPLPAWTAAAALDATSPYGYPGPIWNPDADPRDVAEALRACVDLGTEAGLVTSFIRLHPVLDDGAAVALLADDRIRPVDHGPTVGIDLTRDDEATERAVRPRFRTYLRKLAARGYTVRMDDPADFAPFQALYLETMARLGSSGFYRFDAAYFEALRAELGARMHLFAAIAPTGEVASAGLFTAVDGVIQEHLIGTAGAFLADAPSKLVIVAARDWGRALGARVLHLGGGLGAKEDALYQFKCGFGDLRYRFRTLQVVHRPEAYRSLSGRVVEFFPAYRAADAA